MPSPSRRTERVIASEAQIQSPTHSRCRSDRTTQTHCQSDRATSTSLSCSNPSPMNPAKPTLISPHPSPRPTASPSCLQAPLPMKVVSHLLQLRPLSHSSDPSFFHPRRHCIIFFFFYCKITFLLGFWRIGGWGDSWVSVVVG